MLKTNKQSIGFFAKSDIGFIGEEVYVRKFDNFGICFYERTFDTWEEAYKKYCAIKKVR